MAEPQTNEGQVQEILSMEELSKKIQDATEELNQLKQGLNNLSLEEQNSRLAEIEASIFDCSESLEELENDNATTINQEQLNALKSQVDTLKSEKESLKQQIEAQVKTEMEALTKSVTTTPASEQNQENNEENSNGREKKWLGRQREGLTSKQEWKDHTGKNILRALGGVGILGGTAWLAKKLFTPKDYESEIPGYSEMSRKEKRLARKELIRQKREERREERRERRRERRESGEGRPRWQKFLIGSAIAGGTVIGGVEIYKHRNKISSWVKEKLGLALNFDQARQKVEDEVRNGKIDDDHFGVFNANFEGGIVYNEDFQEICSYGEKTKIDKKNKKLQGLDVEFASYEEMIHAANIVNFAKRKLKGRGATSRPFTQTSWGGDIAFNCSTSGSQEFLSANNSNERSRILGTVGTVGGGLLGGYCAGVHGAAIGVVSGGLGGYALGAYIDNTSAAGRCCGTIARGKNFDLFLMYLNDQTDENGKSLWESAGEQVIDPNGSPINNVVHNGETDRSKMEGLLAEIELSYGEDQTGRRNLDIIRDESNPTEYTIKSYGHATKLTIEGGPTTIGEEIDYSKITKIHIEKYGEKDRGDGLDIDFPKTEEGLKEAIRVINLTNMIREDWHGKGGEEFPFMYGMYVHGITDWSFNLDMDTPGIGSNYQGGTCVLTHDALKNKYPTIFKDMDKTRTLFLQGVPSVEYRHDQASYDKAEGSQFIKFLHQMRAPNGGQYWKKIG